jgi:hypothetical protein
MVGPDSLAGEWIIGWKWRTIIEILYKRFTGFKTGSGQEDLMRHSAIQTVRHSSVSTKRRISFVYKGIDTSDRGIGWSEEATGREEHCIITLSSLRNRSGQTSSLPDGPVINL